VSANSRIIKTGRRERYKSLERRLKNSLNPAIIAIPAGIQQKMFDNTRSPAENSS
jgi:hypothetical protein